MKKQTILLTLASFLISLPALCQIKYEYDDAGNRVLRKYEVLLSSAEIPQDSSFSTGPVIGEEMAAVELSDPQLEESFGNLEVKVYPNPTRGSVYVELNRLPDGEVPEIEIWSPTGILLDKSNITGQITQINLRGRPAGVYIVKTSLPGQIFSWKIIKE